MQKRLDINIHLILFIIIGIALAITIYYYIIPRHWLDDISGKKGKLEKKKPS